MNGGVFNKEPWVDVLSNFNLYALEFKFGKKQVVNAVGVVLSGTTSGVAGVEVE